MYCLPANRELQHNVNYLMGLNGEIIGLSNSYRKIQEDATVYQNLLFHIYIKLNMLQAKHRPSSAK
jgi:hypothetical protein